MIAYCLLVYLDCKTPKCLDEVQRRKIAYERYIKKEETAKGNDFYYVELPVNIISIDDKPYETKDACESNFNGLPQSKEKLLTYNHVCYTVSVKPYSDCFGYQKTAISGGYGVE